ncbi:hypothetical protein [Kitasatospora sp. NPDC059571]|uniref:WXG100 family type VII secretion target n=1 Tax=Kitasatospora sp. NPDC059571 TaxID=3346871 RepID=UPI00368841D6
MDEQTGAEQAHAVLRDTTVTARPAEFDAVAAEPLARLEPMEVGVAAEPLARLEPMEVAEPLARLEPMEVAEPLARLEPMQVAEPMARLEPTEAAEPLARLRPMEAAEPLARLRPMEAEPVVSMDRVAQAEPTLTTARTAEAEPVHSTARTAELRPMEGTVAAEPDMLLQRTATDGVPAEARTVPLAAGRAAATPAAQDAQVKRLAPTAQSSSSSGGGSAGSGFQVDPEQYRAAVSPVLAAADQLSQLVTGLTAFLEHTQSTAPWGNDESGKKFAEGEKGYLKYSADTLKGLKSMPDEVKYIADGLKAMAENYRAAEEGNTSAFQGGDGSDGVSVPQTGSYSAPVDVLPPSAALRNIAQSAPSTYRRA